MNTILKLNRWANSHTNWVVDGLRILLGIFIFYKGVFFLEQTENVYDIFKTFSSAGTYFVLVHYVALAHLCGGFFMIIGLMTRWCAMLQIPILMGAVLINFTGAMNVSNLLQASAALLACTFFTFYGSGRHSVDYSLKLHI